MKNMMSLIALAFLVLCAIVAATPMTEKEFAAIMTEELTALCKGNKTCEHDRAAAMVHGQPSRDGPDCGLAKANLENWQKLSVDDFLLEELAEFEKSTKTGNETFVKDHLIPKYFDDTTVADQRCDGFGPCQVSCHDASDVGDEKASKAWLIMTSVMNFYDGLRYVREAAENAGSELAADKDLLATDFSGLDEDVGIIQADQIQDKFKRDLVLGLIVMASLVVASLAPELVAIPGLAKIGVMAVNEAGVMAVNGGAMTGARIGELAGTVSSLHVGINNAVNVEYGRRDSKKSSEKPGNAVAELRGLVGRLMSKNMADSSENIHSLLADCLSGRTNAPGEDSLLFKTIGNGKYLQKPPLDYEMVKSGMMKTFTASITQFLWARDRTYVIAGPVQVGSSCEDDDRGDPETRVCIPQHPDYVFYIQCVPSSHEKSKGSPTGQAKTIIRPPPGLEQLKGTEGYNGVTVEEMIRGSWNYYQRYGNKRFGLNDTSPGAVDYQQRGANSSWTRWAPSDVDTSVAFNSKVDASPFFNFPICYSHKGDMITQNPKTMEGLHLSQRLPCMCGYNMDVHSRDNFEVSLDETADFLRASGLEQSSVWPKVCNKVCSRTQGFQFTKHGFPDWKGPRKAYAQCYVQKNNGREEWETYETISPEGERTSPPQFEEGKEYTEW